MLSQPPQILLDFSGTPFRARVREGRARLGLATPIQVQVLQEGRSQGHCPGAQSSAVPSRKKEPWGGHFDGHMRTEAGGYSRLCPLVLISIWEAGESHGYPAGEPPSPGNRLLLLCMVIPAAGPQRGLENGRTRELLRMASAHRTKEKKKIPTELRRVGEKK